MNYCSIEDAWKNTDYISDQFKFYENTNDKKNIIENFEPENKTNENNYKNNNQINNNTQISPNICVFTCDDFWSHLNTCKTCRMKVRDRFSSKLIEHIQNIVLDNKDNILLILIAMFILVFFNLLVSIFRR